MPPVLQVMPNFWRAVYIHTYIHTCCFNFDTVAQWRDFGSKKRQIVFLWWDQDSKLGVSGTNRLDCWASSQKLKLDSLSLWWASSPLDVTTGIDSPMTLVIYILVVFISSADWMPAHKLGELSRIKQRIWTHIYKRIYIYIYAYHTW